MEPHESVDTHTHMNIYIKMHKRIALEHKEISEDHEPTNEYSSYNHRIIKIIKNRKKDVEVQSI